MAKRTHLDPTADVVGDAELAARFLDTLGKRRIYALAIASVAGGTTRSAAVGTSREGRFELGSIGKAVNGLILASMLADGSVSKEQRLGSLLPLGQCPASDVTLESLATHTSGLPVHGVSRLGAWRKGWRAARGREADTESVEDVLDQLRGASVRPDGYRYSNLGGAALGHALAAAEGTDYPGLVRARFAAPLKLPGAFVPSSAAELDGLDVEGATFSGAYAEPWTAPGYAPAGGIRASVDDMVLFLEALVSGTAPGMDALEPWFQVDDGLSLGAGWHISTGDGRELVWHNGETGGFSSWVGIDRAAGSALLISCAGHIDLDGTAAAMLLSR